MLLPHHSRHTMLPPDDGLPHYLSVAPFFMLRREKIIPSYQKDVRRASGVTVVTSSPVQPLRERLHIQLAASKILASTNYLHLSLLRTRRRQYHASVPVIYRRIALA